MCNLTRSFKILLAPMLLSLLCFAGDGRNNLVSVQHSTLHLSVPAQVRQAQGSGICIDQSCSVIVTAFHIQMAVGRADLGIEGAHTDKVLSLAKESDANKADVLISVYGGMKHLSYNIAHDIAFVYTTRPVQHKSGVSHSYKPYVGEKVKVAGYYRNRFTTWEAHVIGLNVPLMWGQSQLDENLILDIQMESGTSGSAVLDEQGNLLGMITLSGAIKSGTGDLTASVALPTRAIAEALAKLDPVLGSAIFNDIPDEEPKPLQTTPVPYQESDLPDDTSAVIPELSGVPSDVPDAVMKLRTRSEAASKLMVNFLTRQCLVQGTQRSLCHEVSIVDGQQAYREIGRNGKLGKPTDSFPVPKHGVWTQSDWTDALGEIADNPWVFQGSVGKNYLFTFRSAAEDDRCYYEEYSQGTPLFGGGHPGWKGSVVCFEQVLTDGDFNVVAVFTEMYPPDGCLTRSVKSAIYYDRIKLVGLDTPVLVPVMERIAAKVQGQKELWYANVSWTDYRQFRAEHKIDF